MPSPLPFGAAATAGQAGMPPRSRGLALSLVR